MNKKIFFTSGGTGGHIFPAVATIKYLMSKNYEVLLATDIRGKKYLRDVIDIQLYLLKTDTPVNKSLLKKISSYVKIIISIIKSLFILRKEKPDLVFGFGGYVSYPICLASKILKIPLIIYENNLVLGRTNNQLLPFASKLLIGTDYIINCAEKYKYKINQVGSILRDNIMEFSSSEKQNSNKCFTIIVLGGSQGAEIFADVIPHAIKQLKGNGHKIKIFQQCIKSQVNFLVDFYNSNEIESNIFDFNNNILDLISRSDLAISRCGASTLSELVYTETPFIAIPYPYAMDDHQYLNAKYYEKKGCCWTMEQKNFTSKSLFNLIENILRDRNNLNNMRLNMKKNINKFTFFEIEKNIKDLVSQ